MSECWEIVCPQIWCSWSSFSHIFPSFYPLKSWTTLDPLMVGGATPKAARTPVSLRCWAVTRLPKWGDSLWLWTFSMEKTWENTANHWILVMSQFDCTPYMHHIWVCMTSCWHAVPFWANSNSHWCEASLMQFWSQWKTEANPSLTLEAGSLGRRMLQGIEEARIAIVTAFRLHRVLSPPFPALGNSHDEIRHKHMGRYGQHRNSTC